MRTMALIICVLAFCGLAQAAETKPAKTHVLTVDGKILSGEFLGIENGFARLRTNNGELEISLLHTKGFFSDQKHAQAARDDKEHLLKVMRLTPEKPDKPGKPDEPVKSAKEMEEEYFARPLPPDNYTAVNDFFGDCMKDSVKIAQAYAREGKLSERCEYLSEKLKDNMDNPRAMLDPEVFRVIELGMAAMKLGCRIRADHIKALKDSDIRQEEQKKLDADSEKLRLFFKMLDRSAKYGTLTFLQKKAALDRIQTCLRFINVKN